MALEVDEARCGERCVDEAEVLEVARQLVDHTRRCSRQCRERLHVLTAERGNRRDALFRGRRELGIGGKLPEEDLPRPIHLWVRGQDLLGERRARAWHSEDENGALRGETRWPQRLEA